MEHRTRLGTRGRGGGIFGFFGRNQMGFRAAGRRKIRFLGERAMGWRQVFWRTRDGREKPTHLELGGGRRARRLLPDREAGREWRRDFGQYFPLVVRDAEAAGGHSIARGRFARKAASGKRWVLRGGVLLAAGVLLFLGLRHLRRQRSLREFFQSRPDDGPGTV